MQPAETIKTQHQSPLRENTEYTGRLGLPPLNFV